MSDDFITIREATKLTDKPDITIRRLIRHLLKQNNPEATQMIKQEQAGGGFIYKISKDYLLKELKISEPVKEPELKEKKEIPDKQGINRETETPEIVREIIKTLKSQIYIKDKQIDSLGNKIDNLIERDRETNIILKGLQDRVFLLEGAKINQNRQNRAGNEPEVVETYKEPQKTEKEPTNAPTSEKQAIKEETKEKPKKKGFFSRLFSSKGDTP